MNLPLNKRSTNERKKTSKKIEDHQIHHLKVPPHSIEAEQAVLGGLMIENSHWDSVAELITKLDFYSYHHGLIFDEMHILSTKNVPIDLITISENLETKGILDDIGGFAYLAELAKNTPSATNVIAYAEIIRQRSVLRRLISVANQIADASYLPEGRSSAELLDLAESKVFNIAEELTKNEGPKNVEQILMTTIERIERLFQQPNDGITGVSTGFTDLDKKTAGLQKSDLIIVAARPSMGKTTFAMNLCENASMTEDKPVLIFSLEMPADQIMIRMLSSFSRVDQTKIRTGQLEDEDWARISSAMGLLTEKKNIYIDDSSALTPIDVRARARRLYREHGGLSLIMIDYLQLMRVPSMGENRHLEIAEISRSLKALAKELNVPVVALSQLNRGLESRQDKRPINSDLRESGSIEQDADVIMFIYRDEVYNEDSEKKGVAEIILGKQRNGPIGKVNLVFNGHFSRFDNYTGIQYNDWE